MVSIVFYAIIATAVTFLHDTGLGRLVGVCWAVQQFIVIGRQVSWRHRLSIRLPIRLPNPSMAAFAVFGAVSAHVGGGPLCGAVLPDL